MGKFNVTHWIDLGDFGSHQATITGCTGDLGTIDSVTVELKGETTQLVHLLPRDLESDLLTEIELDEQVYRRDAAEDMKIDAYAQGEPPRAASLREVGSTAELGVAVPPAPTLHKTGDK